MPLPGPILDPSVYNNSTREATSFTFKESLRFLRQPYNLPPLRDNDIPLFKTPGNKSFPSPASSPILCDSLLIVVGAPFIGADAFFFRKPIAPFLRAISRFPEGLVVLLIFGFSLGPLPFLGATFLFGAERGDPISAPNFRKSFPPLHDEGVFTYG